MPTSKADQLLAVQTELAEEKTKQRNLEVVLLQAKPPKTTEPSTSEKFYIEDQLNRLSKELQFLKRHNKNLELQIQNLPKKS